jgi:hypothetical protein
LNDEDTRYFAGMYLWHYTNFGMDLALFYDRQIQLVISMLLISVVLQHALSSGWLKHNHLFIWLLFSEGIEKI